MPNLTTARKLGEMMYNEWDVFAKSFAEAGGGPLNKGYDYWINHTHRGGFLNMVLYIDHFSFWDYKQKEEDLYGVDYGNGDEPGEKFFFYFDWHDDSIREGASVNRP